MKHVFVYCFILLSALACKKNETVNDVLKPSENKDIIIDTVSISEAKTNVSILFKNNSEYVSDGFDFPVGKPNARGYYNAQKFQKNNHLGDDWNGVGGGNSDLGDPIYSIANGYISDVKNYEGGWGHVVRIIHQVDGKLFESLYAHCDSTLVTPGEFIKKGMQIATIGNCNGLYYAHLHLEIRDVVGLDIGPGYSEDTTGYVDPTEFIIKHRN
ncbi:M23 family metallopeptidase [Psychroserpens sp. SPM9]|uniref:M23 family metallopeptidase n=1 Tax=Psychroserpens sp. SPM9 TaxID=2975598 RepID=UPI0021A32A57|nr:M23 family metallopeptidase [Psychroserpens sp. SPM9]MDG5491730.1 M23 family metallopeptidase [Psychroserpens sp. SPM9]